MNCQEFEQIIGDLARRRPLDAGARAAADSHERECARCAARLADERALSAGLRALAATMKGSEAPERVEGALLAAFRARAAEAARDAAPAPAATTTVEELPAGVLPFVKPQADRQWSWKKTLATAATAAAAAAVALAVLVPRGSSPEGRKTSPAVAAVTPRVETTPASRGGENGLGVQTARATHGDSYEADPPAVAPPRVVPAPRAGGRVQAMPASFNNGRGVRRPRAHQDEPEITTEFFPVAQGGGLASGEGGHVVRVELPRSALASYGLPVNAEHAGGRVKADVLLGEDGTARAIRFVR